MFLNNNPIRSITGLYTVLESVMWTTNRIKWLDLSYQYLTQIEDEILNFPELQTLYLHGNFVYQMAEVEKLAMIPKLRVLTLHGNQIEQIPGYRLYVIGLIMERNKYFKKFDTVLITKRERDNVVVWNERLNVKQR